MADPDCESSKSPQEDQYFETQTLFTLSTESLRLDTADSITPHLTPLISSTTITTIHLGGNTLGAPACATLASVLRQKPTLHTANLADIFTSRLLAEIPPALSSLLTALLHLPNLYTIDLSDNAFGLNTQAPLVDFLAKHTPLKHLVLNNNGLGPHAGVLIANALTALAARKEEARKEGGRDVPDLETVICGRNRLESGSMSAWAGAFRAHKNIKEIRMTQNGIRQDGIALLLREGLRGCERLEVLDLQDNTFTHTGAHALAEVVGEWKELRELGLGDSLLGSRGGVVVAEALGKGGNKGLRVLRAQYNEIDAKGVKALWRAAGGGGMPGLRRVELNGNKFSEDEEGVEGLRTLLERRREEAEDEEGEWGMDELSDLEEESEDEDDGEDEDEDKVEAKEEEEEREEVGERILKKADQEEGMNVGQKKDKDVDALADQLGKTGI